MEIYQTISQLELIYEVNWIELYYAECRRTQRTRWGQTENGVGARGWIFEECIVTYFWRCKSWIHAWRANRITMRRHKRRNYYVKGPSAWSILWPWRDPDFTCHRDGALRERAAGTRAKTVHPWRANDCTLCHILFMVKLYALYATDKRSIGEYWI